MTRKIPNGFVVCPGCDGYGEIHVGTTPAVYYGFDGGRAPEDIMKECETCHGEEVVPDLDNFEVQDSDPDLDYAQEANDDFEPTDFGDSDPVQTDDEETFDDSMDGDAESALAMAGFGTDEDYGGASDIDFEF